MIEVISVLVMIMAAYDAYATWRDIRQKKSERVKKQICNGLTEAIIRKSELKRREKDVYIH